MTYIQYAFNTALQHFTADNTAKHLKREELILKDYLDANYAMFYGVLNGGNLTDSVIIFSKEN